MDWTQLLQLFQFGPTDAQVSKLAAIGDPAMAANLMGMGGGQGFVGQPMGQQPNLGQAIVGAGGNGQGFNLAPAGQQSSPVGLQAPNSSFGQLPQQQGIDPQMLTALMAMSQMRGPQAQQQPLPRPTPVNVGSTGGRQQLQSLLPTGQGGPRRQLSLGDLLKG